VGWWQFTVRCQPVVEFGTGYSSLACLRHLPVDVLKLAKPFVDGLLRGAIGQEAQARELARIGCPTARASTSPAPSTSSPSRPSWWPSSTATAPDSPRTGA
jgi:hypothetical protein